MAGVFLSHPILFCELECPWSSPRLHPSFSMDRVTGTYRSAWHVRGYWVLNTSPSFLGDKHLTDMNWALQVKNVSSQVGLLSVEEQRKKSSQMG